MWYSFDYGPIHWIGLSTETDFPDAPEVPSLFGDQLTWLESDLKKAYANRAQVPFILVGGHRPIYASSLGFFDGKTPIQDSANLQKAIEHMFLRYKVDAFFVGHVHSYERTFPIAHNQATSTSYHNPAAPVYFVNGAGGNEEGLNADNQWIDPAPAWSAFRFNQDWGYMTIDATVSQNAGKLHLQFFTSGDNKLKDSVVITKDL
jgi:acid phosphatase type 7